MESFTVYVQMLSVKYFRYQNQTRSANFSSRSGTKYHHNTPHTSYMMAPVQQSVCCIIINLLIQEKHHMPDHSAMRDVPDNHFPIPPKKDHFNYPPTPFLSTNPGKVAVQQHHQPIQPTPSIDDDTPTRVLPPPSRYKYEETTT